MRLVGHALLFVLRAMLRLTTNLEGGAFRTSRVSAAESSNLDDFANERVMWSPGFVDPPAGGEHTPQQRRGTDRALGGGEWPQPVRCT
jgi:hypothetical protein